MNKESSSQYVSATVEDLRHRGRPRRGSFRSDHVFGSYKITIAYTMYKVINPYTDSYTNFLVDGYI